jgi:DNA-binding MarR family transcriptional regulator
MKADVIKELFETASLGAPENAIGFVLWRVVARYQRELDRALAVLDLTNLQFMTLAMAAWMGCSGEAVTQTELARFGGIQPMQVSLMLKTLERKGLVVRRRSTTDVRAKRIEVTSAGLTTLRHALPVAMCPSGKPVQGGWVGVINPDRR